MNELLTARDVARHLRMHVITVYRLAQQGKIPGFKVGRQWRFHREVIDEWERRARAPEPPLSDT
ncbi:MAG: helix-turn-helix domain-containing protein [Armatimonadota bacterium]